MAFPRSRLLLVLIRSVLLQRLPVLTRRRCLPNQPHPPPVQIPLALLPNRPHPLLVQIRLALLPLAWTLLAFPRPRLLLVPIRSVLLQRLPVLTRRRCLPNRPHPLLAQIRLVPLPNRLPLLLAQIRLALLPLA